MKEQLSKEERPRHSLGHGLVVKFSEAKRSLAQFAVFFL